MKRPFRWCARVLGAMFLSVTALTLLSPGASAREQPQDSIWVVQQAAPMVTAMDSIWG